MASELPPTYYFTDITFNPIFYSSGSDNITNEEVKKKFLTYPCSFPYTTEDGSIANQYSNFLDRLLKCIAFFFPSVTS